MQDTIEQLREDLMYLAHRQRAFEDMISEWSEFASKELIISHLNLIKYKKSIKYFQENLKLTHKQTYEKFEFIFKKSGEEGKRYNRFIV